MPKMNGLEAAARIRSRDDILVDIPIIALTANVMREDQERILDCGLSDCLIKPFRKSALLSIISHWCPGFEIPIADVEIIEKSK